jgi:diaminopimelate epimerase
MKITKAHALGNDFLLVEEAALASAADRPAVARALCARHTGVGADGLIAYAMRSAFVARMDLLNADGSYSEVSGNGVRCLAAWLAMEGGLGVGGHVAIETDAGVKDLALLDRDGCRFTFRAAMGQPEDVQQRTIEIDGTPIAAITLRVGNPQCVVLGDVTQERLHAVAAQLAVHPVFPQGTNVELARVERPDLVRILIWERGVGPTEASGTGACAAAVAAIAYGGAARDVEVASPGGSQRVEWTEKELFLTGWAQVIYKGTWLHQA